MLKCGPVNSNYNPAFILAPFGILVLLLSALSLVISTREYLPPASGRLALTAVSCIHLDFRTFYARIEGHVK